MGYEGQERIFNAIYNFGWNSIKHYILVDGLEKESALFIEAALIEKWKTYRPGRGYNTTRPKINGINGYDIPEITKVKVEDFSPLDIDSRYKNRNKARSGGFMHHSAKSVRCTETGEVFNSITEAAESIMVSTVALRDCLNSDNPKRTCGEVYGNYNANDPDIPESWGWVSAHWEYV